MSMCCPTCQRRRTAVWRAANPERARAADTAWAKANPEKHREIQARWREHNQEQILLSNARSRARDKKLKFDLDETDIVIPSHCPVLGILLVKSTGGSPGPASLSLDRMIPTLGYVKGNVRVISWRANNLKRDASAEELMLVALDSARIESGT